MLKGIKKQIKSTFIKKRKNTLVNEFIIIKIDFTDRYEFIVVT